MYVRAGTSRGSVRSFGEAGSNVLSVCIGNQDRKGRIVVQSELPIKKSVELRWQGRRLVFDVAQDLFSSYQVDRGSRMLLDSLDPEAFPATGRAADFGCGYGVLGIAWQARLPAWSMHYVDRDALAVAFSRHNVARLLPVATASTQFTCDISLPADPAGLDLVLWNVPGKAGSPVIAGLLDAAVDSLAVGGVLALVVVHPLADLFTAQVSRDDVEVAHTSMGAEHTVIHIRRNEGDVTARDPFGEGIFDRPSHRFSVDELSWELRPVIGLPEYDSLDHATELTIRGMAEIDREVARWLVVEPGVGHLAMAASRRWPASRGIVAGRDALGIRSTVRALDGDPAVEASAVWGVSALDGMERVELAVVALPEQAQLDDLAALLEAVASVTTPGGLVIAHGRSTEVARVDRLARRESKWRASKPGKLRGSSSITIRRS